MKQYVRLYKSYTGNAVLNKYEVVGGPIEVEEDFKNAHYNFYKGRMLANFVSGNYMYIFEVAFTECDYNKYVNS